MAEHHQLRKMFRNKIVPPDNSPADISSSRHLQRQKSALILCVRKTTSHTCGGSTRRIRGSEIHCDCVPQIPLPTRVKIEAGLRRSAVSRNRLCPAHQAVTSDQLTHRIDRYA